MDSFHQSHYSIKKAGAALGFGTENVILLSTDERGRVIPADLEAKIIDAKQKIMMMESGTTMVGYQPQGNKVNFFRMVVSNPAATQSDIDFLIDEIERLGHDL
ncbi:glutamate decarboxylase 1-like isoform X1 [Lates japonicus]|uniref:Glutamate decarboxylase 1-like isoform X1 n=1 Tax=Lates japonicus TaxID=270547 RepID=A0AAD3MB81_LATJO|nr:glutamate decarboxylase 1-like isoform X1 [Lates japonicus]